MKMNTLQNIAGLIEGNIPLHPSRVYSTGSMSGLSYLEICLRAQSAVDYQLGAIVSLQAQTVWKRVETVWLFCPVAEYD